MNFANLLYNFLIGMMLLPFAATFVGEVGLPEDAIYRTAVLAGYGFALLLHENILTFLTIQKVFLTRVITITLLCGGFLYFADATIPGLSIGELYLGNTDLGFIVINAQELTKYATMLLIALSSGVLYYILKKLKS